MKDMSIAKSVALATAVLLGLSTLTNAATRQRNRATRAYHTYSAQHPRSPQGAAGSSYGGYSTDPHTRALQELADKYRGGW